MRAHAYMYYMCTKERRKRVHIAQVTLCSRALRPLMILSLLFFFFFSLLLFLLLLILRGSSDPE